MKIKIKITEDIIKASKGCNFKVSSCLIARACREIFSMCVVYPTIMGDMNSWVIKQEGIKISLPLAAGKLAKAFDRGQVIEPTSFEIDVPMSVIDQVGIGQAYKVLSESKTLELVSIC